MEELLDRFADAVVSVSSQQKCAEEGAEVLPDRKGSCNIPEKQRRHAHFMVRLSLEQNQAEDHSAAREQQQTEGHDEEQGLGGVAAEETSTHFPVHETENDE